MVSLVKITIYFEHLIIERFLINQKNQIVIHKELLLEYDKKVVRPNLSKQYRDVSIQVDEKK